MSTRGSLLPLVAGLLALTLATALGVVSVTSLTIARHRLVALAEATALHAADSFDPAVVTFSGSEADVALTDAGVRRSAREFLATHPVLPMKEVSLIDADTPDGRRARVVVGGVWTTPLWSEFVPISIPLRAESLSRSVIR